ncbi:MAG TPA: lysophospholipase [Euzebya sp.]|nr:lysophospholipase [Euzebya sp.]
MQHTTDQFLAQGGVTIFTQTWVPASDPRALVVLSHGYAEHSGRYAHVARALTDAGYAVAALDHRGHGRSGGPRARLRDISELSADYALFRDELDQASGKHGIDIPDLPHVLLGHSMGGAVVLDHLIGPHEPVRAVVLSAPFIRNTAPVPTPLRVIAPYVGRIMPGAPTQKLDSRSVSRDPKVVADYDSDPLNYRGAVQAATGAALLALESHLLGAADRITEPTLILHGTEDKLAAVGGSRDLAGALGSQVVDLKTYDGLYHEVFNEPEQDTILADVVAWLDDRV